MQLGLLIGLTRARVALLIAGFAWFVGLDASVGVRILLAFLILAGIAADGLVEDQRTKTPAPAPTTGYDTAA